MKILNNIFINILKTVALSVPAILIAGLFTIDKWQEETIFIGIALLIVGGIISILINLLGFAPLFLLTQNYFKDKSKEEIFVSSSFVLIIPAALYFYIFLSVSYKINFYELNNILAGSLYFLFVNGVSLYFLVNNLFNQQKSVTHETVNETA